jgi:hypothetical protein
MAHCTASPWHTKPLAHAPAKLDCWPHSDDPGFSEQKSPLGCVVVLVDVLGEPPFTVVVVVIVVVQLPAALHVVFLVSLV